MMSAVTAEDPVAEMIVETWGRCTLPIGPLRGRAGTAFLYNELLESTPEDDLVREWLLTAAVLTRGDVGEVRLRPELIEPAGAAADHLAVLKFEQGWSRAANVAATPSAFLHDHARRKGWSWSTQQVTDGVAARAEHLGTLNGEPHTAYALGHVTTEPGTGEPRPLAIGCCASD